jgi:hypothetical protein
VGVIIIQEYERFFSIEFPLPKQGQNSLKARSKLMSACLFNRMSVTLMGTCLTPDKKDTAKQCYSTFAQHWM